MTSPEIDADLNAFVTSRWDEINRTAAKLAWSYGLPDGRDGLVNDFYLVLRRKWGTDLILLSEDDRHRYSFGVLLNLARRARTAARERRSIPLPDPDSEEVSEWFRCDDRPAERIVNVELLALLGELLSDLPDEEYTMLVLIHTFEFTQSRVAREMSLSPRYVSRVLQRVHRAIRPMLMAEGYDIADIRGGTR